jgi:rod shape-determining protein MreC
VLFKFKNRKLITFLVSISVALLLSFFIPVLRNPSVDILEIPLKITDFIGQELKAFIFFHHNFRENKRLNKEIGLLRQKLIQTENVYLENQRLKKILSFTQGTDYRLVAAKVIARDPSYWNSVVVIDKGIRDGIRENAAVIGYAGLAGKVVEVGSSTCKVMLLNDPNFRVSALVQRSRQEGLVSGALENRLIMRYLLPEADVKIGDIIITSGLTEIFPPNIVIGTVVGVRKEYSGLSLYCTIKPAMGPSGLEEVLVVIR